MSNLAQHPEVIYHIDREGSYSPDAQQVTVNGQKVDATKEVFSYFEGTAGSTTIDIILRKLEKREP